LIDLAPAGFEEVEGADGVELAVYADAATEAALREVFGDVESVAVEPGWEDRWRSFHRPVHVGGVWVGPPWETPPVSEPAIVIDPGRAFGTGAHATTRASIELLAGLARSSLLDVGCGSGVVAIAGAKLGFSPVFAVDLDPIAVDAARENARRNDVAVEVHELDAVFGQGELPRADVVVANLDRARVQVLLARLSGQRAIVSGYPTRDLLRAPGWLCVARLQLSGWAADSLIRR